MNSAELTTFLNEDRAAQEQARLARLMENITRRAARLFDDGYTATECVNGLYARAWQVRSPEGKRYTVKVSMTPAEPGTFFGDKCSCECFAKVKTCKHLQALRLQVECEAALDAQAAQDAEYHDEYLAATAVYA